MGNRRKEEVMEQYILIIQPGRTRPISDEDTTHLEEELLANGIKPIVRHATTMRGACRELQARSHEVHAQPIIIFAFDQPRPDDGDNVVELVGMSKAVWFLDLLVADSHGMLIGVSQDPTTYEAMLGTTCPRVVNGRGTVETLSQLILEWVKNPDETADHKAPLRTLKSYYHPDLYWSVSA